MAYIAHDSAASTPASQVSTNTALGIGRANRTKKIPRECFFAGVSGFLPLHPDPPPGFRSPFESGAYDRRIGLAPQIKG